MRNPLYVIRLALILFWGLTTFFSVAQKTGHDLWPIKNKKAGEGVLFKPREKIGDEFNKTKLFIGAPEGELVVAPRDGVISSVLYIYPQTLVKIYLDGMDNNSANENNVELPSEILHKDQKARESLATGLSESLKFNVDPQFISMVVAIKVAKGEKYVIMGLRPVSYLKVGAKVKKGDSIGTVGYAYHQILEPCIGFSRSINTKSADPMSIFGIESTFYFKK